MLKAIREIVGLEDHDVRAVALCAYILFLPLRHIARRPRKIALQKSVILLIRSTFLSASAEDLHLSSAAHDVPVIPYQSGLAGLYLSNQDFP